MHEELLDNQVAAGDLYRTAYQIMSGPYRASVDLYEKLRGGAR